MVFSYPTPSACACLCREHWSLPAVSSVLSKAVRNRTGGKIHIRICDIHSWLTLQHRTVHGHIHVWVTMNSIYANNLHCLCTNYNDNNADKHKYIMMLQNQTVDLNDSSISARFDCWPFSSSRRCFIQALREISGFCQHLSRNRHF